MLEKKNVIRETLMPIRQRAEARGLTEEEVEKEIKAYRDNKKHLKNRKIL